MATRQQFVERLWRSVATLPYVTSLAAVATAIACTADVPLDIRAALLQTTDGTSFWTAQVGAVANAARPEDIEAIDATFTTQNTQNKEGDNEQETEATIRQTSQTYTDQHRGTANQATTNTNKQSNKTIHEQTQTNILYHAMRHRNTVHNNELA